MKPGGLSRTFLSCARANKKDSGGIILDLSLTIGTVIVSLSIFILFAFGAARAEKVVAGKAQVARQALQVKATSSKPASAKKK
jgi:ABC-type nickel/cobalt efflux system permease component RcnA